MPSPGHNQTPDGIRFRSGSGASPQPATDECFGVMWSAVSKLNADTTRDDQCTNVLVGLAMELCRAFSELKSGVQQRVMSRAALAARQKRCPYRLEIMTPWNLMMLFERYAGYSALCLRTAGVLPYAPHADCSDQTAHPAEHTLYSSRWKE